MAADQQVSAGFAPIARRPRARTLRRFAWNQRLAVGALGFLGFFAVWELGAQVGIVNTFFFSSPLLILSKGASELQTGDFWRDVGVSLMELAIGYAIGGVLGVVVGLAIGWYRRLNLLFDPWLSFLYAIPKVAVVPIIVLSVGLNVRSVIVAVMWGTLLTVTINVLQGVHTVDRRFLEVARSYSASQRRLFLGVVLPSTVPFILAGLRLGVGHAMIGVFVGELFASTGAGLGYFIDLAGDVSDSTTMLFGVIVFTILGMSLIGSVRLLEQRYQRWRPDSGRR